MPAPTTNTPPHLEHRIETSNGRTLAVAEWGDPDGIPLIEMHGTPGGRISYWEDPSIYARHGLRRLTYDRPGYAQSTRQPGRRVADAVTDVQTITAALGIDRFAVSGASGGGPHALACAVLMPQRVVRCLVEVSIAPYPADGLDWLAGMTPGNVEEFEAALKGEEFIRPIAEREAAVCLERIEAGRADFLGDGYELSVADLRQMEKHFAIAADDMRNSLSTGVDGWVDDDIAFVRPWGSEVQPTAVPVLLIYGKTDVLVPAAHGDWLAARLPHAQVVVNDDAGHMGNDEQVEATYAWLAGKDVTIPAAR